MMLNAISWLLGCQFFLSSETPGLYQVIRRSGMGLKLCPELADAACKNESTSSYCRQECIGG